VQIGRGSHPVSWASTSPVFYQAHQDVVNFTIPEAAGFTPTAPYIAPRVTEIGNDVYIGHGAFVMQGVKIGDGAIVGACSVVTKDVPPYAMVAGSPATIRKMRFRDDIIERMNRVRWWDYAFWDLRGAPIHEPEHFLDVVETKIQGGMLPFKPKLVRLSDLL
jgi:hypothetical protein